MSKELLRINKRKLTESKMHALYEDDNNVLLIHYSCESFYNIKDGRTPRITSIAIRNLGNSQTVSFSIHKVAEKQKVNLNQIEEKYDELEKKMLKQYFDYINKKENSTFIHWNMRDINYGFSAIEHRYEVLGGKPIIILDEKKFDLASEIITLYGVKYISHGDNGRLLNLLTLNKITNKDILNGKDEADAFENQEYIKLHQSTLKKVDSISNVFKRLVEGTLKTNSSWFVRYGYHPKILIELIKEHWIVGLISLYGTFYGLFKMFSE